MGSSLLCLLFALFGFAGNASANTLVSEDGSEPADSTHKVFYYHVIVNVHPEGGGTVGINTTSYGVTTSSAPLDTIIGITVPKSQTVLIQQFYIYGVPTLGYYIDHFKWGNYTFDPPSNNHIGLTMRSDSESATNAPLYKFDAFFEPYNVYLGLENPQYGTTELSNIDNQIGDTVTLTAHPYGNVVNAKFLHWIGPDGTITSTDNPYSFIVTEENRGKYYAEYAGRDVTKGFYCMITNRNVDGQNYENEAYGRTLGLTGLSDSLGFFNAYATNAMILATGEAMHSNPAFVIKVTGTPTYNGSLEQAKMEAQGSTFAYRGDAPRSFIDIIGRDDAAYFNINGSFGLYFNRDIQDDDSMTVYLENFGKVHIPLLNSMPSTVDKRGMWQIDDITAADSTVAYFGAMPATASKISDCYYTTMYTAFPYQCLDSVRAYTVSALNDDGTVQLDSIESGIVPAYTPVILACKSTQPRHNRLLPLIDEPAPLNRTNLLKGEIWLKDYKLQESDYRTAFNPETMRVLSTEGAKFTNTNNVGILADGTTGVFPYIVNNTAYLDVSSIDNPRDTYTLFKEPTTGVSEELRVKNEKSNTKKVYSITGQYLGDEINSLPKGIYIYNGHKIIK